MRPSRIVSDLDQLLRTRRTIVCVGPGGVGKTTTSAALAVRAALLGRRTLVLTVDPAHRLANSLGLASFEAEEQQIGPELFAAAGLPRSGPLYAMMLDTKRTFDSIVDRYASPEARDRILESVFYQQASTHLAGSQEYMAMEKLYEIHRSGRFDLIILDTPPTVHALDFLDAPTRLVDFMGIGGSGVISRSSQAMGRIGRGILKVNSLILRGIGRFIGADVFMEILNFLSDFSGMYAGFKERATDVRELLASDDVAFIVICGPERASVDEGLFFYRRLVRDQMPFGAFVVNRVRRSFGTLEPEALERAIAEDGGLDGGLTSALQDAVREAVARYEVLATRDLSELERLSSTLTDSKVRVCEVPAFDGDIHDLAGLYKYGLHLCPPAEAAA